MSNQDLLINFYKNILASVRYVADSNGAVSKFQAGDTAKLPVVVSGKSMVLPTKVQMDHPDWSNRIAFHPMREDFTSGQSPIFEDYRRAVNHTLQVHTGYIMLSIADMSTKDKDFQKNLPRDAADYLRAVKDGDTKFTKTMLDILGADPAKHRAEMEFIRINVQKSRKVDGQVRKRVATVVFPILEKLLSHSKENKVSEIAGVGVRGIDRSMIIALYKLLFPLAEIPGAYDTYSDSLQAPSMDALLRCASVLIERINETAVPMIGHIPSMEEMIIPYNWKEIAFNIDANANIFNAVPMLDGNVTSGHVIKNAAAIAAITVPTTEEAAKYAQASVSDPNRNISVAPVNTPQLDTGVVMQPMQPMMVQPSSVVTPTPQQQMNPQPTSFKLDGPRANTAPITHPGHQGQQQSTRIEQPQVAKHNTVSTPQQITDNSQPLFGQTNQANQMPASLPGMPQGQPTPVQTAMGVMYMFPDGTTYTQQQLAQVMAAAQIEQAKQQQQKVQELAANPAMRELMAINPMAAMMSMQGMMPGMMQNGMMPMQQPMVNPGRMPGTAYVPLGNVQPVNPGQGMMPNGMMPMQMQQMPMPMPGMMPGVMPMPGMMPNGMPQQVIPGMMPNGMPMQGMMPMMANGMPMQMPMQGMMPGMMPMQMQQMNTGRGIPGF